VRSLPPLFLLVALTATSSAWAAAPEVVAVFPAVEATDICRDAPLSVTFSTAPVLNPAGSVKIYERGSLELVDTIEFRTPTDYKTIGGIPGFAYHRFLVNGNTIELFPKPEALARSNWFSAVLDRGDGTPPEKLWEFRLKDGPARGTPQLTVAADGTGDFCTVQGALDFLPAGNKQPVTIFVREGTYREIVAFSDKDEITLRGEDRAGTVITCANNNNFNPAINPYRRGLILAHHTRDFTITNLTLRNTTPPGGSQAEALILDGTSDAHAIVKDVDLYSSQDTLQINGQAYVSGCHIEGDVDFVWGTGPCFLTNCTLVALRSNAYYTQIRNPAGNHGYVFKGCRFDGPAGVTGNFLSRIEPGRFPASAVVLLDCVLGPAVGAVAWRFDAPAARGAAVAPPPDTSRIHFWESNSHTADGQPVDVSRRLAASRQLRQPDDAAVIASYSSPVWVLGGEWNPVMAGMIHD